MGRSFRWAAGAVALVATATLCAPASAGDGDAAPDPAVAAALEAAATRMKAQVEEARLLEAAGRREEAIAALRQVGPVHEASMALVRTLLARSSPRPTPAAVARAGVPRSSLPPRSSPRPVPPAPRSAPRADPVRPAVRYLLACRGADGWFRAERVAPGATLAPPDAATRRTTALALVALADAVVALGGGASDADAPQAAAAVRAAADVLAREVGPDGAAGPSVEEHLLGTWALATAVSRVGDDAWRAPLARALRRTVAVQGADGLWHGAAGELDAWRLSALAAAGLHEALALPDGSAEPGLRAALARLADAARAAAVPASPRSARWAAALLAREGVPAPEDRFDASLRAASSGVEGPDADVAVALRDPWWLLLGTLYAHATWGFDDDAEGRRWWDSVLVPAAERFERAGADEGSFAPEDDDARRLGRAATTSLALLAWLVPTTPWTDPVDR